MHIFITTLSYNYAKERIWGNGANTSPNAIHTLIQSLLLKW